MSEYKRPSREYMQSEDDIAWAERAIVRIVLCAAGAVGLYIAGSVIAALWAYAKGWV